MTIRHILGISIVSATPFLLTNGAYAQGHGSEDFQSGQPCFSVEDCNSRGVRQDNGAAQAAYGVGAALGVAAGMASGNPVAAGAAAAGALGVGIDSLGGDTGYGDSGQADANQGAASGSGY